MRKSVLVTIFLLPLYLSIHAQDTSLAFTARIDFVNQNVWRGCYQAGASIQPEAVVSYRHWEFSVWGTTDFDVTEKEIDWTVTYKWKNFSIGITDYWFGGDTDPYGNGHIPEINLKYGFSDIPVTLSFNSVIYGDDKQFSPYLEGSYVFEWRDWYCKFATGITPWRNTMLYTGSFACTCLSAGVRRSLPVSDVFSVEVFADLIYNPNADNAFWIAGISFPF
jgi:hypothetical protein